MAIGTSNPLRQQLINMMYLVLLALLALNVSAEVLEAFEKVGKGIEASIEAIHKKNDLTMAQFDAQMKNDAERARPFYKKAQKANQYASSLYDYIDKLKKRIVKISGGIDEETGTVEDKRSLNIPAQVMITEKKGPALKKEINKTRDDFIELLKGIKMVDIKDFKSQIMLKAEDPKHDPDNRSWSEYNFQGIPTIAALTLLTKMQNDVKTTQADVLDKLLASIGATEISFDVLTPVIKAPKSAVAVGEKYKAEILLAAYSSTQNPDITVSGNPLDVQQGTAEYTAVPKSPGSKEIPGKIQVKNPNTGEVKDYPFKIKYDVFKAPAIISADAMRVFYRGLDNPVSVSVPGYKPEQVHASISRGRLTGSKGKYVAKVGKGRKTTIRVSVKTKDGMKSVGSEEFRIKPVPKPIAYFGSKASGSISPGEIKTVNFIIARLGESFVFEGVKYKVDSYKFIYQPRRGNAKMDEGRGPRLTRRMKGMLSNPQKGDMIIITNIDVIGPDGKKRLDNGITLTVE